MESSNGESVDAEVQQITQVNVNLRKKKQCVNDDELNHERPMSWEGELSDCDTDEPMDSKDLKCEPQSMGSPRIGSPMFTDHKEEIVPACDYNKVRIGFISRVINNNNSIY